MAAEASQASTAAVNPSPEEAPGALPGGMSLAELFPSEAAIGAASPDGAGPAGTGSTVQAGHVEDDAGGGSQSRVPLVAGLFVTLVILIGGGGFLWWRNRDSAYWPA